MARPSDEAGAGTSITIRARAGLDWAGETNLMATVPETRILSEELEITWKRMREALGEAG